MGKIRFILRNRMSKIKNLFMKITGLHKIRDDAIKEAKEAVQIAEEAKRVAEEATELERLTKLTSKERATENKEPFIAVTNTHVNPDNVRNGFFELDWNEYFVLQLRTAGYLGETEEEVVDRWFNELCKNLGAEEGVNMDRRGAGYISRALRDDGKTEVS
jgi:hypothetical protein